MQQQIIKTPSSKNSQNISLFVTPSLLSFDDCPYCEIKKKFNIGDSENKKCVTHSIIDISQLSQDLSISNNQYLNTIEMVELLKNVEMSLDYYWNNLREISGGNVKIIHKQLQPVLNEIKIVQEKIGRFFYQSVIEEQKIKSISTQPTHYKKHHHHAGSQKFIRSELISVLDFQENNQIDSIKQWVTYFYKIIQLRVQPQSIDLLPYQQDIEMKIFKQSMEKKFIAFAQEISRYQHKVRDVLTKLIFYMDKSSEIVSEKQLEADILFIQGENITMEEREAELERVIFLQALSVQEILSKYSKKC